MGGWGIIAADVIVMANLAQIAGSYSYQLVGATTLANSVFWSTVAGIVWIIIITYICYRGIEISARIQYALLGIEVFTLIAFAIFALAKVYFGGAPKTHIRPSLSWFSPSGLSATSIVTATLIAVFIYWGWDTAVATNEEADDPATTPGRAAVLSTVLLLLTYAVVTIAAVSIAGVGSTGIGIGNPDNAADVFAGMGKVVFGTGLVGAIMVFFLKITVLTSASASTQTTILPTARTSLSMGAYKAIPERFARIHPKYLTPTDSTIWMGAVSIVFYVGLTLVSQDILADTIAAVGLMIAFYYGLTGFACAWYYRKTMWSSKRNILMQGVIPLIGGILLLGAFLFACHTYYSPDYGETSLGAVGGVFIIGIGSLLVGVVLMFIYSYISPSYFRGETLPRGDAGELLLVPADGSVALFGLPDSGEMPTVIAPDLSNLPPGETAIDPFTGRTVTKDEDD
jgi:amino acid transporter